MTKPVALQICKSSDGRSVFARKVVLVEGYSDRVALLQLANHLNRDLDAGHKHNRDGWRRRRRHVFASFRRYGPQARSRVGMCNQDQGRFRLSQLQKAGHCGNGSTARKSAGFIICVKDLEQEFVRALGLSSAQAIIATRGKRRIYGLSEAALPTIQSLWMSNFVGFSKERKSDGRFP